MISSQVSNLESRTVCNLRKSSLKFTFQTVQKTFRKTPLLPLKYLFISDFDMEASPRKKKRSAKDAKKSAKQRAEKSTNSIDEEVSLIRINGIPFLSGILDILLTS